MNSEHSQPEEGATCACCWDDISASNYVEYKASADDCWHPSGYCVDCIDILLKSQWQQYNEQVKTVKCKAEQRRLLTRGPPINLRDPKALPCPEDGEVHMLWYMQDNAEHSAKLEGSLTGEERKKLWDELMSFYIVDEKEEVEGSTEETA